MSINVDLFKQLLAELAPYDEQELGKLTDLDLCTENNFEELQYYISLLKSHDCVKANNIICNDEPHRLNYCFISLTLKGQMLAISCCEESVWIKVMAAVNKVLPNLIAETLITEGIYYGSIFFKNKR